MTDTQTSEWIKWKGGECPVNPDDIVEVKCRHMAGFSGFKASDLDWEHEGDDGDVMAYRVVKP